MAEFSAEITGITTRSEARSRPIVQYIAVSLGARFHETAVPAHSIATAEAPAPASTRRRRFHHSVLPSLGNGLSENTTSTGTSKKSAMRSARCRLGLYSPRSR